MQREREAADNALLIPAPAIGGMNMDAWAIPGAVVDSGKAGAGSGAFAGILMRSCLTNSLSSAWESCRELKSCAEMGGLVVAATEAGAMTGEGVIGLDNDLIK